MSCKTCITFGISSTEYKGEYNKSPLKKLLRNII